MRIAYPFGCAGRSRCFGGRTARSFIFVLALATAFGADATLTVDGGFDPGAGADQPVVAVAPRPDGSVWIGGLFANVQGVPRVALAKLDGSGRLVAGFDAALSVIGTPGGVLALESDGEGVLVGGSLSQVKGEAHVGLVRLNDDGTVDERFKPPFVAPSAVTAVRRDAAGDVYVAGALTIPGRTALAHIVRLHADGSLDPAFAFPDGFFYGDSYRQAAIASLAVDARGRLLAVGDWEVMPGFLPERPFASANTGVLRLWPDGTNDASFIPDAALGARPSRVLVQSDGRVLLAGVLGVNGGTQAVARLHADGTLDTSFNAAVSGPTSRTFTVDALVALSHGELLIGGDFTGVAGQARNGLALLHADGSLAATTLTGGDPDGSIVHAAVAADGGIFVVGDFTHLGGASRGRVAKLRFGPGPTTVVKVDVPASLHEYDNGVLRAFAEGAPPLSYTWSKSGAVVQRGTESTLTFVGVTTGDAGAYRVDVRAADGTTASASANVVVTAAGGYDAGFKPSFYTQNNTSAVVLDDGSLVLGPGMRFTTDGTTPPKGIVHFTPTGGVDPSFAGGYLQPQMIARRIGSPGIWVAGDPNVGHRLAALDDRFAVDPSFALSNTYRTVGPIAPVAGGGVMAMVNHVDLSNGLMEFLPSGQPDPGFAHGVEVPFTSTDSGERTIAATPDHWVYVGTEVFSTAWRYQPDGTLDATFPNRGYSIVPSLDGEVYLIDQTSGTRHLVKVGRDGAFDASYHSPPTGSWSVAAVDGQGRAWGIYQSKLARLLPSGDIDPSFAPAGTWSPNFFAKIVVNAEGTDAYLINFSGTPIVHVSDVAPPGSAALVNLSSRASAGTGGDALIAGFVTRGGTPSLLLRAVGPTLQTFGVTDALSAARLQLYRGSVASEVNEQWAGIPGIAGAMAAVGAFELPTQSRDAALLLDLPAAGYTAMVTPQADSTAGVALAEIYLRPGGDAAARLFNVSTRARAAAGEKAVVLGFVLRGDGWRDVLVRGVGSGQRQFGVTDVLASPVLTVYRGPTVIARNTGWDDVTYPEFAQLAAQRTGAFALERGAGDAALLLRLPAGSYTATVASPSPDQSGIVLAEVYEVDP